MKKLAVLLFLLVSTLGYTQEKFQLSTHILDISKGQGASNVLVQLEKLDGKKEVTIDVPTDKPGTYNYACGMDMFHGKVVVK